MGIVMILLTTFVVYNIVTSVALLPPSPYKEMHMRTLNDGVTPTIGTPQLPFNVYMHLFVENEQEVDLNRYLPYIDIIANKYTDLKYHLIIVFNDTSSDPNNLSAEENNENALHSLWARNSVHRSLKHNVNIEFVTLSKYLDKSPLREHWKQLPKQFIEFLTRAVSIWDKGGVAFNPTILTPRSPHANYIEKLQNILKNFHNISKKMSKERKVIKNHHTGVKKKLNNIRDIIDALEHDDNEVSPSQDEIDSEVKKSASPKQAHESAHFENETGVYHQNVHPKLSNIAKNMSAIMDNIKAPDSQETLVMAESKQTNYSIAGFLNNTMSFGILPMFLEYLFKNKAALIPKNETVDESTTLSRKRKHVLPPYSKNFNKSFDQEKSSDHLDREFEKLKPLVIPAKLNHIANESIIETHKEKAININPLTIDLKGNIVSSEVSCHAFLGTMFSNAIHSNPQESLTDFIIEELSIFCKGVLSSCNGIDVILL